MGRLCMWILICLRWIVFNYIWSRFDPDCWSHYCGKWSGGQISWDQNSLFLEVEIKFVYEIKFVSLFMRSKFLIIHSISWWGRFSSDQNCLIIKQWPLAGEFVEFEYSPKIRQIFVTRSGEFGEYWANFCDSLRRIWRVLSKFLWLASANLASIERFGEFGEFGEFGKFGEGRLDRFIHKKIFFCI
jgi:hypothetical protein